MLPPTCVRAAVLRGPGLRTDLLPGAFLRLRTGLLPKHMHELLQETRISAGVAPQSHEPVAIPE
jgi:hypothetical protein